MQCYLVLVSSKTQFGRPFPPKVSSTWLRFPAVGWPQTTQSQDNLPASGKNWQKTIAGDVEVACLEINVSQLGSCKRLKQLPMRPQYIID